MRKSFLLFVALLATLTSLRTPARAVEPKRERIEWANIWVTDADKTELPRVLMIGDSIVMGYYGGVESRLGGKAACARLATSKCICDPAFLPEVELLLKNYGFDVIHFNNGLHGFDYSEKQYGDSLGQVYDSIKKYAPEAKLIWALSTPIRRRENLDEFAAENSRVDERNRLVEHFAKERQIPINDLNKIGREHPDFYSNDAVHFNAKGQGAQAQKVAEMISEELK